MVIRVESGNEGRDFSLQLSSLRLGVLERILNRFASLEAGPDVLSDLHHVEILVDWFVEEDLLIEIELQVLSIEIASQQFLQELSSEQ